MTPDDPPHIPVMLEEALRYLKPREGGRYVDGTLGAGGHAKALLKAHRSIEVIGIDRDAAAVDAASNSLREFGSRVHPFRGSYIDMPQYVAEIGWDRVDGVLLDLGLSSIQLDTADRGFSYAKDGPLDMRFDQRSPETASTIVNSWEERELTDLFREYGEEPNARRIARSIVRRRADRPFSRTSELADLIRDHAPLKPAKRTQTLGRCFQALRIAVNQELEHVTEGLEAALSVLAPGGVMVVISFHSLEDRLVKNFFKDLAQTSVHDPTHPMGGYDVDPIMKVLTKRPERPTAEEIAENRRSAPSRLRAAQKLRDLDPDSTDS